MLLRSINNTLGRHRHQQIVDSSDDSGLRCQNLANPNARWPGANLFRNPFGELNRKERAALAVVDIKSISDFVKQRFRAYQLIGDCGRGKTTRLLKLRDALDQATYVYLPEDQPCPPIAEGSPILIDEAQRLPRRARKAVFKSGLPLVLATHQDLSRPLRRAGYHVTTERIGLSLTPERLAEILNRRIDASRRDPGSAAPQINLRVCAELIRQFGTDVRGIEGYLYDIVQSQVNDHGEMRFIG